MKTAERKRKSPGPARGLGFAAAVALLLILQGPAFCTGLPEVTDYKQLLKAIGEAQAANQPPTKQGNVRAAWTIGKLIEVHVAAHKL